MIFIFLEIILNLFSIQRQHTKMFVQEKEDVFNQIITQNNLEMRQRTKFFSSSKGHFFLKEGRSLCIMKIGEG